MVGLAVRYIVAEQIGAVPSIVFEDVARRLPDGALPDLLRQFGAPSGRHPRSLRMAGERKRKWVYGKTHDEVHEKWIKLQTRARQGSVPTTTPTLASYLAYWHREVVEPNLAPKDYREVRAPYPPVSCPGPWRQAARPAPGP